MKIKVCGMKEAGNIQQLSELQPDYMGFIHYAKSPRYAGEVAEDTLSAVPASILKTLVVVNELLERVEELIQQHHFVAVQLHGAENPDYCRQLKDKVQVLKAFGINQEFNFAQLEPYKDVVNYFLFDTKVDTHGGSGQTFDWQLLNNYTLAVPFFLSGGLSLENIESVKQIKHPQFYGVDLNSRFETAPGIKDIHKLKQAFNILRSITHEVRS